MMLANDQHFFSQSLALLSFLSIFASEVVTVTASFRTLMFYFMCPFSELQAEFDARKDQRDFAKHQQDIVFGSCDHKVLEALENACNSFGLFAKASQTKHSIQVKFWENPSAPCDDLNDWSCLLLEVCMDFAGHTSQLNWSFPEVFHLEKGHAVILVETC